MTDIKAVDKVASIIFKETGGVYLQENAAIAVLAAIQADPLAYVKPKPLEWVFKNECYVAKVMGNSYVIEEDVGDCDFELRAWSRGRHTGSLHPTLEAAQAAAETHRNEMLAKELF